MRRLLLFLLPLLLLAAGCLSPEEQLVGKWRGKMVLGQQLRSTQQGQMASGFARMVEPQLDLRPDKTFTLSFSVAPLDGTWKLDKGEITLTPKSVMGMSTDDARNQAQKALKRAQEKSPFPIPFASMPMADVMHAHLDEKTGQITLDPAGGTILGGFGKIVFTKV